MNLPKCIVFLGQTATGKTELAVHVAKDIDGEIVNADSRQVYKGMDIGTGKDLLEYTISGCEIPYYNIDIKKAGETYSVFEFSKAFKELYPKIINKQKVPIIVGGSGLYISAVVDNYDFVEVPENNVYRKSLEVKSTADLVEQLKGYKKLHNRTDTNSRKRLIRALEIAKYSKDTPSKQNSNIEFVLFGIRYDKEELHNRIYDRLEARLRLGMVEEVERLIDHGVSHDCLEYYGLEYKYISYYLRGIMDYNQMKDKLFIAIRQFAKRQRKWFSKMERNGHSIAWVDGGLSLEHKIESVKYILESNV